MENKGDPVTMSRSFERYYPWIISTAVAALLWLRGTYLPDDDGRLSALLSVSVSTSAIFVGFMATVKAILMALPSAGIKDDLKRSGEINTLSSYIFSAILSNLLFCAININSYFFSAKTLPHCLSSLWFFFAVAALTTFFRVCFVMMLILRLA